VGHVDPALLLGDLGVAEGFVRVREVGRAAHHRDGHPEVADLPRVYAPSGRLITPDEIAAAAIYWLADEAGPISGSVVELEQHPFIGRNPPKDPETLPGQKA